MFRMNFCGYTQNTTDHRLSARFIRRFEYICVPETYMFVFLAVSLLPVVYNFLWAALPEINLI